MKKNDKTLLIVLRFLKATLFVVFIWSGLFCCVFVPGTLAFHLLYTFLDELRLIVWFARSLTVCDHVIMSLYLSRINNQHGHWV